MTHPNAALPTHSAISTLSAARHLASRPAIWRVASWAVAAISLFGTVAPAVAQFTPRPQGRQPTGESLVAVDLLLTPASDRADRAVVDGRAATHELAVVMRIEPQWHIYWRNPGASGMATEIRVTAPEGFGIGDIRWPAPKAFRGEEGITYGYEGAVALFVPIAAPIARSAVGSPEAPAELSVSVDWLVCRGICLIGSAKRTITIGGEPAAAPPAIMTRALEQGRANVPKPLATLERASARIEGTTLIIEGPVAANASGTPSFFPIESPGVRVRQSDTRRDGDRFIVRAELNIQPENALDKPLEIGGVVVLGPGLVYQVILPAVP